MSFTFVDERLTWVPVKWNGRTEEGETVEHSIDFKVVLVDRSDVGPALSRLDEETDKALEGLKELVRGWRGVVDAKRKQVPMTDDLLRRLLEWPGFIGGFAQAYGRAWAGIADERAGSSESPDAGPEARAAAETETA